MVLPFLIVLTLNAQQTAQTDRYRPLIHFSPARNWTNDPCGLYFADGRFHVFFQHNPHGDQWGHMSWGHASSTDLVRWTEHDIALQEENGEMIFTGSAVVDQRNTSGLCAPGHACPVLIYTGHQSKTASAPRRERQNLASGDARGLAWKKFAGNPVLDEAREEFRDPKVFWHDPTNRWIMAVALASEHKAAFYGSPDLKSWTKLSEFGPAGAPGPNWECPEFFELPVRNGRPGETRWVLKIGIGDGHVAGGSGEQYFVGTFDGATFVNDNSAATTLWFDHGRDCYCTLAFSNQPKAESIKMLGWMSNWSYARDLPSAPFRGQMTIARDVSLRRTRGGIRLVQQPAGLDAARGKARPIRGGKLDGPPAAFEVRVAGKAKSMTMRLANSKGESFTAGYDAERGEWFADRTKSGAVLNGNPKFSGRAAVKRVEAGALEMRAVVDASSVELFASNGEVSLTNLAFPSEPWTRLEIQSAGGIVRATVTALGPSARK